MTYFWTFVSLSFVQQRAFKSNKIVKGRCRNSYSRDHYHKSLECTWQKQTDVDRLRLMFKKTTNNFKYIYFLNHKATFITYLTQSSEQINKIYK